MMTNDKLKRSYYVAAMLVIVTLACAGVLIYF